MWQRYLKREHPCVLFKCNMQKQNDNYSTGTSIHKNTMLDNPNMIEKMTATSKAIGSENLLNILKNYSRVEGQHSKFK